MAHLAALGRPSRTPRWLVALLAVLIAVPLAVAMAGPAAAHTKLVSSNPAEGAALDAPPTTVVLVFNEEPKSVTSVKAQDSNGPLVALGDPVLDGTTVTVSWPQDQAPGLFRLVYVLVSDDGDPVEGTLLFSYAGGTAASPSAATPEPTVSAVGTTAVATGSVDSGSTASRGWLIGLAVVLLVGLVVVLLTRRRRGDRLASEDRERESSVV